MSDPVDVVARTLWGEARGEGRAGMEAVAAVISNRVHNPRWWGQDWVTVCKHPWQFSCWNLSDPNLAKITVVNGSDPTFVTATLVAENAINGRLADSTGGADSYYALGTPEPAWAAIAVHTVTIGRHAFYRTELKVESDETLAARQPPVADTDTTADDLNAAELSSVKGGTA